MKNKKTIILTLIAIIAVVILTGCTNNKEENIETNNQNKTPIEITSGESEKINIEEIPTIKPTKILEISEEFKKELVNILNFKVYDKFKLEDINTFLHILVEIDYFDIPASELFLSELENITTEVNEYMHIYPGIGDGNSQIVSYKTSSTLEADGYDYSGDNLGSVDFTKAWVEGVEGYGIGEKITLKMQEIGYIIPEQMGYIGNIDYFEEGYRVATKEEFDILPDYLKHYDTYENYLGAMPGYNGLTGFYIVNGYAKSEELFKANSRVKKMKLTIDNNKEYIIELEDTMNPQLIDIDYKQEINSHIMPIEATFEILEVYEGEKYQDTAITSIMGHSYTTMLTPG